MVTNSKSNVATNTNPRATIGDNSTGIASRTTVQFVPVYAVDIWKPAGEQLADVDTTAMEEATVAVGEGRQRFPVPVRDVGNGKYQAVAKAYLVEAVRRHNEQYPHACVELEVRVNAALSIDGAYRLLAQDVEQDHTPSSLARGQFFARAVKQFGNEKAAAAVCGVSPAAVSKNLDVARCLAVVGPRVAVHRDIAQRDATWLMGQVGREIGGADAPDSAVRMVLLDAIDRLDIAPAKKVFAILRGVVKPLGDLKPRKGVHPILIDGRDVGVVRAKKGDRVTIELNGAGDIPVEELMANVGAIVARTRD